MQSPRRLAVAAVVSLLLAGATAAPRAATAQADVLPGSRRPEVAPFPQQAPPAPPLELPKVAPPEETGALAAGVRVFVRAFHVEGSSVFTQEELAAVTAPWTGREIASEDLLLARDAITKHYVERGYLTSGAVIPDQQVTDGVVVLQVVEGALATIDVRGTRRFRKGHFRTRLRRAGRAPVSIVRIEEELQRFQRDPRVKRVQARLDPGERRGEAVLVLDVEEERFYGLELVGSNESSPSIGSHTGEVAPTLSNLIGWGDEWRGELELSEGLREVDASFSVPLPPFDTRLATHFQDADSDVIEEPFDDLEIESDSTTWGVGIFQPVWRTTLLELEVGAVGEYRTSETRLLDECFAFVEGTSDCESKVSVLRIPLDAVFATRTDVVAARSTVSAGLPVFGASERSPGIADGEFVAWLGQVQWAHRLPAWLMGSETLARVDVQLANDELLGIEKFAVGGLRTVRGYRENQLVRDNGVVASLEVRVPVWRDERLRPIVQVAPFFDYGRSWDEGEAGRAETLSSAGIGLRVSPFEWVRAELYWGHGFDEDDVVDEDGDLQDDGVHFLVTVVPF
jgi:hemolysin activation/secretion protein